MVWGKALSESQRKRALQTAGRLGLRTKEVTALVQLPSQFLPRRRQDTRPGVGKAGGKVYIQEYNVYLKYLQCWLKQYFYNFFRSTTMYITGKLQWFNLQN